MAFRPSQIKRNKPKRQEAKLMLTPMVDIFICLLLFLLQSYSAGEEVIMSDQYFQLPVSVSQQPANPALTIKVNNDVLVLDGQTVASTHAILVQSDLLIEPLYQSLLKKADQSKFIASKNQSVKFQGEIIIQGDHDIPFILLKKIMYTCSRAEYGNIALAVLQKQS